MPNLLIKASKSALARLRDGCADQRCGVFNSGGFCPEVKCTVLNEISTSMGNPGTVEDLMGSAAHEFYKILSSFAAALLSTMFYR